MMECNVMLWWGERRQHTSTCQGPGVGAGRMFVSIKSILMIFEWKCGWLWVGWAGLAGGRSAFKYGYCQARNVDQLHTATSRTPDKHNTSWSEGKLILAATALGQDFLLDRNEILHNMHASEYNENISHFVEYWLDCSEQMCWAGDRS